MADRAHCCIFGCRRTFKRDADDDGTKDIEYMCGKHYRMAPKALRQMRTRIKMRGKRHGWSFKMERVDNILWMRAKRAAMRGVMGI